MRRLRTPRRDDTLIRRLLGVNVLLVSLAVIASAMAAELRSNESGQAAVLALVVLLTVSVNLWMLQRRFRPLEDLISDVERVDPAEGSELHLPGSPIEEIDRLSRSFNRLLDRVEQERRRSNQLVLRAQEEERGRVARDLHDEVNQALTAILLRLEVLAASVPDEQRGDVAELKGLTARAIDELINLARQLRPAALDDHGLVPAIEAQVRGLGERTGIDAMLNTDGPPLELDAEKQTVIYRIAQEALTNAGRHAGASHVEVDFASGEDGSLLRVTDDGCGFDPREARDGGLGLEGMAERARLVGGELTLRSAPGDGTEITLRVP
jgi:two-component system, NarL family, sensor histidine kinase UhpB